MNKLKKYICKVCWWVLRQMGEDRPTIETKIISPWQGAERVKLSQMVTNEQIGNYYKVFGNKVDEMLKTRVLEEFSRELVKYISLDEKRDVDGIRYVADLMIGKMDY